MPVSSPRVQTGLEPAIAHSVIKDLVRQLPVSEVWVIAGTPERRLNGYGVRSIWDLGTADLLRERRWFDVLVMCTAFELACEKTVTAALPHAETRT